MEKIALAIGKTSAGLFSSGHFGDSDRFAKYILHADGTLVMECEIPNQSKEMDETHGAKGKLKSVLAELGQIHCVVSGQMSPNFKRMALQSDVQPVVVKCTDDTQLFACFAQECQSLFDCVARRQKGDRSVDIPVFDGTGSRRPLPIQNESGDPSPETP